MVAMNEKNIFYGKKNAKPIVWAVIIVIMSVKTFKTDIIVFIRHSKLTLLFLSDIQNWHYCFYQTYSIGLSGLGFRQAQQCVWVKPVYYYKVQWNYFSFSVNSYSLQGLIKTYYFFDEHRLLFSYQDSCKMGAVAVVIAW
jgi:hypothetical protein